MYCDLEGRFFIS